MNGNILVFLLVGLIGISSAANDSEDWRVDSGEKFVTSTNHGASTTPGFTSVFVSAEAESCKYCDSTTARPNCDGGTGDCRGIAMMTLCVPCDAIEDAFALLPDGTARDVSPSIPVDLPMEMVAQLGWAPSPWTRAHVLRSACESDVITVRWYDAQAIETVRAESQRLSL